MGKIVRRKRKAARLAKQKAREREERQAAERVLNAYNSSDYQAALEYMRLIEQQLRAPHVFTASGSTQPASSSVQTAKGVQFSAAERAALRSGHWKDEPYHSKWGSMAAFQSADSNTLLEYLRTRGELRVALQSAPSHGVQWNADKWFPPITPVVRELTVRWIGYLHSRDAVQLECEYEGEKATVVVDGFLLHDAGKWGDTLLQIADEAFNGEPANAAFSD